MPRCRMASFIRTDLLVRQKAGRITNGEGCPGFRVLDRLLSFLSTLTRGRHTASSGPAFKTVEIDYLLSATRGIKLDRHFVWQCGIDAGIR